MFGIPPEINYETKMAKRDDSHDKRLASNHVNKTCPKGKELEALSRAQVK